jgi:hypothetical protein
MSTMLHWAPDLSFPAGDGATWDRFVADDGEDVFEIDTTPWGDADLMINGRRIAHVEEDLRPADAFCHLEAIAASFERDKLARRCRYTVLSAEAMTSERVVVVVH